MKAKILIVDDEPAIVEMLSYNLQKLHYQTLCAYDGPQALQLVRSESPDLLILDLMLPGMDGFEVCRELRHDSQIPIIMLTARDEEIDRVVGLELGADDYVVKPFSVRELMARVKSVLRRTRPVEETAQSRYQVSGLSLDLARRKASWNGATIQLTALEFDLLAEFIKHAGQVLSREQLVNLVWGYDYYGDVRVVDSAIKRLRQQLRDVDPMAAQLICTVRSAGYKLEQDGL